MLGMTNGTAIKQWWWWAGVGETCWHFDVFVLSPCKGIKDTLGFWIPQH